LDTRPVRPYSPVIQLFTIPSITLLALFVQAYTRAMDALLLRFGSASYCSRAVMSLMNMTKAILRFEAVYR